MEIQITLLEKTTSTVLTLFLLKIIVLCNLQRNMAGTVHNATAILIISQVPSKLEIDSRSPVFSSALFAL